LRSRVTEYLEEACFDVYSAPGSRTISLFAADKQIQWKID
jgi:hypothetical protein